MGINPVDVTVHIDENLNPEQRIAIEDSNRALDGVVNLHLNTIFICLEEAGLSALYYIYRTLRRSGTLCGRAVSLWLDRWLCCFRSVSCTPADFNIHSGTR
jgi:hypothetical protein